MRKSQLIFLLSLASIVAASTECQTRLSNSFAATTALCEGAASSTIALLELKFKKMFLETQKTLASCTNLSLNSSFATQQLKCLRSMHESNQNQFHIPQEFQKNESELNKHTKSLCANYSSCNSLNFSQNNIMVQKNSQLDKTFDEYSDFIVKSKTGNFETYPQIVLKIELLREYLYNVVADSSKSYNSTILFEVAQKIREITAALKKDYNLKKISASQKTALRFKMWLQEVMKQETAAAFFLKSKRGDKNVREFLRKIEEFLEKTDGIH